MADIDGDSMIRSAERLVIGVERVPTGRAVLRRRIVVEQRTITVEVAHEEAYLEILPLDGTGHVDGAGQEQAHGAHLALPELVLREEQIVVTKRIVPVERVRMVVESVTEQRTIVEDVRHEQIDVIGGDPIA